MYTTRICINKSGKTVTVPNAFGGAAVGKIGPNELFVLLGGNDGRREVAFYKSGKGWVDHGQFLAGQEPSGFFTMAYQQKYRYGADSRGHKFKILHRQCRIFSGENVVATVKPGGYVVSDGASHGGSKHPYRLSIKGYYHSGSAKYVAVTNGWCDTDIEVGKCMYNTVTTDGKWV
ncbi:hypothetical protein J6TS1_15570 [Siminovitchia terrae]|uniref:Lectin n=1 Tax=Siminovitchia terrae TaxID=1914933 RepID=A0ABQ4KUG4_SIMTE|nr:hypothetical protein [Siminovitchia terrae]GIN91597.1 hypothetical protein J22TS1_26480 [Siminovitchia terrae]GIN95687.1 hypothetical protein J6TS1_15570 [Siminovitchia terrae]